MANIIDIDAKEASKKLVVVEKHVLSLLLVIFGICIGYLFIALTKVQQNYIDYILVNSTKQIKVIEDNTAAFNNFSKTIEQHCK